MPAGARGGLPDATGLQCTDEQNPEEGSGGEHNSRAGSEVEEHGGDADHRAEDAEEPEAVTPGGNRMPRPPREVRDEARRKQRDGGRERVHSDQLG